MTPPDPQLQSKGGRTYALHLEEVYDSLGVVCFELVDVATGDVRVLEVAITEFHPRVQAGTPASS